MPAETKTAGCPQHAGRPLAACRACRPSRPGPLSMAAAREWELQAAEAYARRAPAWAAHVAGTLTLGGTR